MILNVVWGGGRGKKGRNLSTEDDMNIEKGSNKGKKRALGIKISWLVVEVFGLIYCRPLPGCIRLFFRDYKVTA
jgi:hypothetical protein